MLPARHDDDDDDDDWTFIGDGLTSLQLQPIGLPNLSCRIVDFANPVDH